MKKSLITTLTFFIFIFTATNLSIAAEQPKSLLPSTHALAYKFEKQGSEYFAAGPIITEVSKSKSDTISSLDQIVVLPSNEYKSLILTMVRMDNATPVGSKTYQLPQKKQFILDMNNSWNISDKANGRYMFVIFADSDILIAYPFSITD